MQTSMVATRRAVGLCALLLPVALARGFAGIAFRVQPDLRTYDAFYLRPTNGRADDQVRRNHAAQYSGSTLEPSRIFAT
jgi:hypothetical protein